MIQMAILQLNLEKSEKVCLVCPVFGSTSHDYDDCIICCLCAVCREWLVREDSVFAYQLQNEESEYW